MSSTLGGEDPAHDLGSGTKDRVEQKLREKAAKLFGKPKERNRLLNRAVEISRKKAKRSHQ